MIVDSREAETPYFLEKNAAALEKIEKKDERMRNCPCPMYCSVFIDVKCFSFNQTHIQLFALLLSIIPNIGGREHWRKKQPDE